MSRTTTVYRPTLLCGRRREAARLRASVRQRSLYRRSRAPISMNVLVFGASGGIVNLMDYSLIRLQHMAVRIILNTLYCIDSHLVSLKLTIPSEQRLGRAKHQWRAL